MKLIRVAGVLLCAAMLVTACAKRATEEGSVTTTAGVSPQGDSWDSIKLLPDWSGGWSQLDGQMGNFEDCCIVGAGKAPFTPEYKVIRDAAAKRIQEGAPGGFNLAQCLPDGVPGLLLHGIAFQFFYSPGRVTMLFENGEVRRIFTDGREHKEEDKYQSVEGHSIGHWEDGTLVVDTVGMRVEASLFLTNGMKVTKDTRVVERMHLKDKDTLQIDTEITDPVIFAAPYKYSRLHSRLYREEDFPVGCAVNMRDNQETVDLTPPPEY